MNGMEGHRRCYCSSMRVKDHMWPPSCAAVALSTLTGSKRPQLTPCPRDGMHMRLASRPRAMQSRQLHSLTVSSDVVHRCPSPPAAAPCCASLSWPPRELLCCCDQRMRVLPCRAQPSVQLVECSLWRGVDTRGMCTPRFLLARRPRVKIVPGF